MRERIKQIFFPTKKQSEEFRSSEYWERRYSAGGNSGAGSYAELAMFKAETVNKLVTEFGISKVVEFGCGDGNNASLYCITDYIGLDISHQALSRCRERFANDKTKRFAHIGEFFEQAEMSMSLDVIYHLVEDTVYRDYMSRLFACAGRYVLIYSSCVNCSPPEVPHVRHRNFLEWISVNRPDARFERFIANSHPAPDILKQVPGTSFADFFLFAVG